MPRNLANPNIKHVFVLMLENRSFDHMLGFLAYAGVDPATGGPTQLEGLQKGFGNTYNSKLYPAGRPAPNIMTSDPAHEFKDVLLQLCGHGSNYLPGGKYPSVNNSGFVEDFATSSNAKPRPQIAQYGDVMRCYDAANQLPILTALAQEYAVCDHWYSSLPGPTWPNRFFVHAASSCGLDHSPKTLQLLAWETLKGFKFQNGTIFDRLAGKFPDKAWRIYRGRKSPRIGSIPCVAALRGIHLWDTHPYEAFETDLHGEYPYLYTFIEPNYGDILSDSYSGGQSQHPRDDVRSGEELIRSTYDAIRKSPLWLNSVLIIAYDEHGGFVDHVPPPPAVAPGDTIPGSKYNEYGFTFEQYGARVPALVISAYTPKRTISHFPYDHASIPATLETLFGLQPMTRRDAAANNLTSLLALSAARTDTLPSLDEIPRWTAPERSFAPDARLAALENETPLDGGNAPGFVHVVKKADMERQQLAEPDKGFRSLTEPGGFLSEEFTTSVETRGSARAYLEATLLTFFGDR